MKIIVIGGGPSGMMAAITAAINHEVILLEKNDRLAIKLLMSGNGRCNITNNKPIDEFINNCSKSTRFMYSALSEFSILDLINFFENNGCKLMEEDNNRMFPVSNKAKSILEVFEKQLIKNNVKIKFNTEVKDIEINNDLITVKTNDEDYKCDDSTGFLDLYKVTGYEDLKGSKVYTWNRKPAGIIDIADIFRTSNNPCTAQIALKVDAQKYYAKLQEFE